jgi:hypothetical protein
VEGWEFSSFHTFFLSKKIISGRIKCMQEIYDDSIGKIIRIPEGEEGVTETFEEGMDNTENLRDKTLTEEGYDYAIQIPLGELEPESRSLLLGYLNMYPDISEFSENEKEAIYGILARYTDAIDKYKPKETIKNYEDNVQLVNAYDEFMRITDQQEQVQTITFEYALGNRTIRTLFDVYPIRDSQSILNLGLNLSLFDDLSTEEMNVYSEKNNENLSEAEKTILRGVEEKISRATMKNAIPIITEFLSMQLRFHGCENTQDEMREAIKRIPLEDLVRLYDKVNEVLHLDDVSTVEVFQ